MRDDEPTPSSEMLEEYLRRFARSVDPRRADANAAGLMFATATTIALGERPSPETVDVTERLVPIVARQRVIRTHSDLRLLAIHGLWRSEHWRPSETEVRIPLNRIQLFSPELLNCRPNAVPGIEAVQAFVADARKRKLSSRDADAFASSNRQSIVFFNYAVSTDLPSDRILTGVTPEIYDSAVRALIDSDHLSYGGIDPAIMKIVQLAPFWPDDLVPGAISRRDADLRAGLLARIVVHADRCGLLALLFEHATNVSPNEHLQQLAKLLRRYEDVRSLAYRTTPVT
jgi:hypothetical protein